MASFRKEMAGEFGGGDAGVPGGFEEDRSAGNLPEGKFCHNMAPRSLYMLKGSPTFTHLFVKFTIRAVFNLLQGQWSRPLQDPYEHLVF